MLKTIINKLQILEKCFARGNNTCGKPVEAYYYSVGYPDCCCCCGSKRHLVNATIEYSMRKPCKQNEISRYET